MDIVFHPRNLRKNLRHLREPSLDINQASVPGSVPADDEDFFADDADENLEQ